MWMDEYLETWKAWRGYREEGWVGLAREAWFATRNPSRFMMMPNWGDAMELEDDWKSCIVYSRV